MATATAKREARYWELFSDWCESMEIAPLPTTAETISAFLKDFPAPIETQGRRVKAIRRAHERAGQPLELPTAPRPVVLREGADWAEVPRALAQVPKYQHEKHFPVAVRGRRDGWLLVLVGIVGLSRNEARSIHHSEVRLFPQITVKGVPIFTADPASECPACAVTRWLRIAGAVSFGFWNEVKDHVRPDGFKEGAHDCTEGLDGVWRQAATLLPAIDQHGWATSTPMSARAISTTMVHRQALGPIATVNDLAGRRPAEGRFADATMNELADAYDDVDERAAAVLLRLKELDDLFKNFEL